MKGDLEKRKTYRRGVPPGPFSEQLQEPRNWSSRLDVRRLVPAETNFKIKAAMDQAKAAGRPIEKLTFKMICDMMQDKFKAPWGAKNSEL